MNGVKTLKFGTDEYTIEDLLARESLNTKVSKTLKNQTLTLNSEIEIHLWNGYKEFTITAGTFLRAEYIDYKLDDNEWVTVNLDQEDYPYTIDVTDVQVIALKGGGASIYPITLTCDLISDTEGLPSHSSTDNGKFLRVNAQGNAEWQTDNKQDKTTITTNSTDTIVSLTVADNNEYRYTQDLASLTLTMPSGDFISSIVFESGTTPTQMTYDSNIKWSGDDVTSNAFVPVANKTYNIVFWFDGININAIARGV